MRGVSQQAHGDEINPRFRISPDIFQANSARAFNGNSMAGFLVQLRASCYRRFHVFWRHVIEKNGLGSAGQRLFEFVEVADFYLDRLRATAPVAVGAF